MTAAARPLTLPDALQKRAADLESAFSVPYPSPWDDELEYDDADQPAAIGALLVEALHGHLMSSRIGYLFKKKLAKRAKVTLAQASAVKGKLAHYTDYHFLIVVNWEAWVVLSRSQRVAVIDHELCHFGVTFNDDGEMVRELRPHDIEEFAEIVDRWGLWKGDLIEFAKSIATAPQLNLFDDEERETKTTTRITLVDGARTATRTVDAIEVAPLGELLAQAGAIGWEPGTLAAWTDEQRNTAAHWARAAAAARGRADVYRIPQQPNFIPDNWLEWHRALPPDAAAVAPLAAPGPDPDEFTSGGMIDRTTRRAMIHDPNA